MKKEYRKISGIQFSLMETDQDNEFLFFRKDKEPLIGDNQQLSDLAISYYRKFLELYKVEKKNKETIYVAISTDRKVIMLIIVCSDESTCRYLN